MRELVNLKLNVEDIQGDIGYSTAEEYIEYLKVVVTQKLNIEHVKSYKIK